MDALLSVSGKALRMRRGACRVGQVSDGAARPFARGRADCPSAAVAATGGRHRRARRRRDRRAPRPRTLPVSRRAERSRARRAPNGCTRYAEDVNAKTLFASVEDALACARTRSACVNLGSKTENQQLLDLSRIATECARWSLPLLAMIYPRGPGLGDRPQTELIAHAANVAADLGADIVKLPYSGDAASMPTSSPARRCRCWSRAARSCRKTSSSRSRRA